MSKKRPPKAAKPNSALQPDPSRHARPQTKGQITRQGPSSPQSILQNQVQVPPSLLGALLSKRWMIARSLWNGFFRFATLLSVSYLVYDRFYEADATIAASASDPQFAFEYPFTITNNSHVFKIRDVHWKCEYIKISAENISMSDSSSIAGSTNVILPGKVLNIDCSVIGPNSRIINIPQKPKITEAIIKIEVSYKADLFGLYAFDRKPEPALFRWFADASNPQWIKGEFAK